MSLIDLERADLVADYKQTIKDMNRLRKNGQHSKAHQLGKSFLEKVNKLEQAIDLVKGDKYGQNS